MMTKTYGDISLECLRGQEYARPAPILEKPSLEEPVLDLSFKKSPPASPKCELASNDSCPPSPHRVPVTTAADFDSDRLRHQQHQYNHLHHQQQPQEDTSGYSSSSVESLRRYSLTPPSDSECHKKLKLHHNPQPQTTTVYSSLGGSLLVQSTSPTHQPQQQQQLPIYPVFPLASVPCIPMSAALSPTLLSPTIAASVSQQQLQFPASTTSGPHPDEQQKKAPRPFKAYPKDPLSLSMGPDVLFDQEQKKAYSDFRSKMLDSVKRTSEGTNVKMRRTSVNNGSRSPQPTGSSATATSDGDERGTAYWERRRKNNEAAKRSRDARRAKEDEIAIRAAFLEQEYIRLKYENAILRDENTKFKCLLYGR